ncbi:nuclear transport factor 2 family protein [Alcanivorax sp. S6407]|uniref:nuclear transport factor 2 family protein n=1 Tax=Alcanivorax sp. S6407 TaxID=2926424 RepID=UPI001FF29AD6|nr:nuclear transport factor 2 family protein [Alcanivorax sp. S6407]MCK0154206.1 nuclear transport factor 2 family protein [Alcanivorax sp. S6407]
MKKKGLNAWHEVVKTKNLDLLKDLIADDAVFHSPLVHTPQEGKPLTLAYLTAAMHVLANDSFHYVREVSEGNHSVLEFALELDDIAVNGVDMITWNDDGKIIDFKVMVRPYKAIESVRTRMAAMLEKLK